ncbi:MAG: hypothetical protein PHZ25_00420 [Candidatus Pacebacteria bacterium]|nr:hypothetical protein [Candidatus Paceibacterota bacterium]
MNKKYPYIIILIIVLVPIFIVFNQNRKIEKTSNTAVSDYKNISYIIDGNNVKLENGYSETEIPQSSLKTITRYFGNDLITDLNNDSRDDVVFLITQQTGGSGTFYYAVSALNTEKGYIGSDGYYLGDRIAPQTINNSQNPKHKNVIVVNYADRKDGEPMTTQPSVGKSAYLKLDENNRWGVVVADFEGESR